MKLGSRSTILFLLATLAIYIYDRGTLAIFAVILAAVLLIIDIEQE